jgi:DNA-binding NarL/FixJ family response regulator
MSTFPFVRVLVLDDDPMAAAMIKARIHQYLPGSHVQLEAQPKASPGYDIYFIDNDFDGQAMGHDLIEEVRRLAPRALVVAFSGTLDAALLRRLMNLGCDAVCDKSHPEEFPDALRTVRDYVDLLEVEARPNQNARLGLVDLVQSLRGLLKDWNRRLDRRLNSAE